MANHQNYGERCIEERRQLGGGILEIAPRVTVDSKDDLSRVYTPGVAAPCLLIEKDKAESFNLTSRRNSVAIISDGTAVLGLGNIGPEAALPVMEGKAVLFKKFAGVDAMPLVVDLTEVDKLEAFVRAVAPSFGGINLEDISAPRCVELVERLGDLGIPLFHDDQDGTAVVVYAALQNALKVTGKKMEELKVVINGAGAAGYAITKMLTRFEPRPKEVLICDSKGIMHNKRELAFHKKKLFKMAGVKEGEGNLADAMKGADLFIGVSKANVVNSEMVKSMADEPIVFALANPDPEILPDLALEAGAAVVGTGRSDFDNQINNALVFPGLFRGALDARVDRISGEMMFAAAHALASMIGNPTPTKIIPLPLDEGVGEAVGKAVYEVCSK